MLSRRDNSGTLYIGLKNNKGLNFEIFCRFQHRLHLIEYTYIILLHIIQSVYVTIILFRYLCYNKRTAI